MVTKAQKTRVIIFISIVVAAFFYLMFILVGQKMFTDENTYYIRLERQSVSGLNIGGDVRYYGITVGKITDFKIDWEKDISEILVSISVRSNIKIKETVKASLDFTGITGLKVIELTGGNNDDPDLKPGGYIVADKGILDDLSGKTMEITAKVEKILNNMIDITSEKNSAKITNILTNFDKTLISTDEFLVEINSFIKYNKPTLNNLLENSDSLIASFTATSNSLNDFIKNSDELVKSEETAEIFANLAEISKKLNTESLNDLVSNITNLISDADKSINHMDKMLLTGRKSILRSIQLLKETLENVNEFSILIRENPDILIKGQEEEEE